MRDDLPSDEPNRQDCELARDPLAAPPSEAAAAESAAHQRLTNLLVMYQRALAASDDPAEISAAETAGDEQAAELEKTQACLRLLEQVRRAAVEGGHDTGFADSLADEILRPSLEDQSDRPGGTGRTFASREIDLRQDLPRIGRFQILRELGVGGHGVVLLAHDPVLQRDVALKVPRPESLLTPDSRRRFAQEAQAAARLKHPNLVPVYEVGEFGPICFITSAYCDGPNLAEWLAAPAMPMVPRHAARWMVAIARAVGYAHSEGVLHRDLKPSNILLARPGFAHSEPTADGAGVELEPFVTDFGLAKLSDGDRGQTRAGTVIGTPAYMAPEQAAGNLEQIGPTSDVYALGVILYEMLAGRPPFLGESDLETLRQIHQDEAVPLRRLQPQIPRDLETICLACLEKEPARRYATPGALADDLDRFLNHQPIHLRPPTVWRRSRLWIRRHPTHAVALAALLALVVGIPSGLVAHSMRLQHEHDIALAARADAETSANVARANEARVRQHVYVADMRVAMQLRQEGDLTSLSTLLDRYAPQPGDAPRQFVRTEDQRPIDEANQISDEPAHDPRGFEWHYLDRFRGANRLTLPAHGHDVDLLEFSSRGDLLVTASTQDGAVRLWEIPSGRPREEYALRRDPPVRDQQQPAALSPDGRRLATLVDSNTIDVWDIDRHERIVRLRHSQPVHTVAFLAHGAQVVGGADDQTTIWDCATGEEVSTCPPARLIAVSPDGRQLGLVEPPAYSITARLMEIPLSPVRREFSLDAPVRQMAYAPDGTMVALLVGSRVWSGVRIYQPRSSTLLGVPVGGFQKWYNQVGFSGDSQRLVVTAPDGSLQYVHPTTGQILGSLRGPATRLSRFAFSPDDRWLATAVPSGNVLIWDNRLLDPCEELSTANEVVGPLAYSPDGKRLAVATPHRAVLLIDVAAGRVERRLPVHNDFLRDLAFSPDGSRLVTTDGEFVYCWDCADGRQQWKTPRAFAQCLAWSPRQSLIAVGGMDRQIYLAHAHDGSPAGVLNGHDDAIRGLRFMPHSDWLLSASLDATIRVWNAADRTAVGEPVMASAPIDQIALSADGKMLVAGYMTGVCHAWKIVNPQKLQRLSWETFWEGGRHSQFALSPDGRFLCIGALSGNLRAIDLKTQFDQFTISGRRVGAVSVTFGPDGRSITTVSRGGCLTHWDLGNWRTTTLDGAPLSPVRCLAFSADGATLAVGSDDSATSQNPDPEENDDSPTVRGITLPGGPPMNSNQRKMNGRPWDTSGAGFRLWDVVSGREQTCPREFTTSTAIPLLSWSSRGLLAAGSGDGTVWIWQRDGSKPLVRFAVNDDSLEVLSWKPQPGHPPMSRSQHERLDGIATLAFSPNGRTLAIATKNGIIQLADADDWEKRMTLCTDADDVTSLAFSPAASVLVANRRGQLLHWSLSDLSRIPPTRVLECDRGSTVASIAFSHDGAVLAVGRRDGSVQLALAPVVDDRATAEAPWQLLTGHLDRVVSLSFAPDDRTLATGSWDTTVRLWHVASGQELATLKGHHGRVEAVTFSPRGDVLASGGERDADHGEVLLWRASD